jgi:hypothetical protein
MTLPELQAQQRTLETAARKGAMTLAVALAKNPRNDILPALVEAAALILKVAEMRAATIPASDVKIIKGDIEGDALGHFLDLLHAGMPFEEVRARAVEGIDEAEAAFQILIAKRGADTWVWAEQEMNRTLAGAGLAPPV